MHDAGQVDGADETQVRVVTGDDIGLKVLYEPPPDARGVQSVPSVEYGSSILLEDLHPADADSLAPA